MAGLRVPFQVRSLDVAPTISAALGLAADESWQGRDLLGDASTYRASLEAPEPAVEQDAVDGGDGSAVDGTPDVREPGLEEPEAEAAGEATEQVEEPGRGHHMDRVVIAEEDFEGNVLAAIRTEGFKYIRAQEGGPRGLPARELFDVQSDRIETRELLQAGSQVDGVYAEDHAKRLDELLNKAVLDLAAGGLETGSAGISAAECERLKALGYLGADEECGGTP